MNWTIKNQDHVIYKISSETVVTDYTCCINAFYIIGWYNTNIILYNCSHNTADYNVYLVSNK